MAQVKKFQSGGKLFIDGHEINLEDYYGYASGLEGQSREAAMDLYNSAKKGNIVEYDSGRNFATGVNWSNQNQEGFDSANKGKGWTTGRARRQAFFGGKGDAFARALQEAGRYTILEPKKPEETALDSLFKTDQRFDYNEIKGKDGKISRVWSDSLSNADQLAYFNSIRDAILNWDEEKYKTKYISKDLDKLRNIKAKYDLDNNFFTNLETGFKGGNFDNQELWDNLYYMGFLHPDTKTQQTNNNSQNSSDPWADYVNPFGTTVSTDILKSNNARITKDENGQYHFHGMENSGAWFLNDYDFLKGTQFEDGVMLNGNLYSKDQIQNLSLVSDDLRKIRDLINARRNLYLQNPYEEAVRIEAGLDPSQRINYRGIGNVLGTSYNFNKNYIGNGWYEYFKNLNPDYQGNYQIADVTGNFSELSNGSQIFSYINPNAQIDLYGRRPIVFAYRDQNGNIQTFNSQQALTQTLGITPLQWNSTKQISSNPFNEHGFAPVRNFRTVTGNKDDTLFVDKDGNYRLLVGGYYKKIKPNSDVWKILIDRQPGRLTDAIIERDTAIESRVKANKKGGKLEIKPLPKFQYGGNVMSFNTTNLNKDVEANYNPTINEASTLFDGDLTSADKWQLGAMAADLASVISSFTNASGAGAVVTGVTGLGGTAAQFVADVKRDGFDLGDAGRAGLGLVFDAAGMLPGLGTMSKLAKISKNASKMTKAIGKAISIGAKAGMAAGTIGAATQAYDKLKSGEKLNVDDLRNILTVITGLGYGTRGVVNAGRASKAASEIGSKMAKNADGTVTLKSLGTLEGAQNITLSKSDANTLEKLMSKKDAAKKIQDFLKSKTGVTVEEADLPKILDNYGFDTKSKWFGRKERVENEEFSDSLESLKKAKEEHGTGYYFLHGSKRNAILNQAGNEGLLKKLYADQNGLSHRTRTYLGNRSVWDPESVGLSWNDKVQNNWFVDFMPRTHRRVKTQTSAQIPTAPSWKMEIEPTVPLLPAPKWNLPKNEQLLLPEPTSYTTFTGTLGWPNNRRYVYNNGYFGTYIPVTNKASGPKGIKPQSQSNYRLTNLSKARALNAQNSYEGIKARILRGELRGQDKILDAITAAPKNKQNYILKALSEDKEVQTALKWMDPKFDLFLRLNNTISNIDNKQDFIKLLSNFRRNSYRQIIEEHPKHFKNILQDAANRVGYQNNSYPWDVLRGNGIKFKKGGKIIKADEGLKTEELEPAIVTASRTSNQPNDTITLQEDRRSNVPWKKYGNFNWDKLADLGISLGRYISSSANNKRLAQLSKEAVEKSLWQEQMPTEIYNRFQDNGIRAAYNARANQERMIKPVSRDFLKNAALEQTNKAQADNVELEGILKEAEAYQQYQQEDNAIRRQYALPRNEIVNRNNQRLAGAASGSIQSQIGPLMAIDQSQQNASIEAQNRLNKIMQENQAFDERVRWMQFQNSQNPNRTMTNKQIETMMQPLDPRNRNGWWIKNIQYAKKGTKLRSRLDADEQIWVNQNKATANAIKRINDNIMKLIMKVLS